ncbi:adenosine deaminase [Nocardioides anomalus]|uniref:Adenine deaminase n=1 Tax=Nocardioides anomalus TaxID=2712223 RepID=A0A6G6WG06_9ACTN|nr:adenosine deaminase [Nocardioides anomalus]QIG43980.1 adenosine deaminase [Nocardioides anomalus]
MALRELVTGLAKAELHLHLEGTLEPELAFALAARNGVSLPYAGVAALRRAYDFADLQSFLDLYYACMAVLRTAEDFRDLAAAYLDRARADGVVRAEVFFDPQEHTARGVPLAEVVAGLSRAAQESVAAGGPQVAFIACAVRHRGPAEALAMVESLEPHVGTVVGLGLDSTERGHPPRDYARAFDAARGLGLRTVAHAGEEGPPAYVWEALDVLGVERVDHGVRCVEDAALVRRLAADGTPLTVCPLSNVRLRVVDDLRDHPLPRLLDAGVRVTLNSDDPAYFGGYVADNYVACAEAFGWSEADLTALARASLDSVLR